MEIFKPVDFDNHMSGTTWRGKLAQVIRKSTQFKAAAEYHVRCVRVGYPTCWVRKRMWECAKFEIHLGHVEEDPNDSWIRSRPEELLAGLMVEKQPTEKRPGLTDEQLMSPQSHWPHFWNNVVNDEDGWAELTDLIRDGYRLYLASHDEGQWWYSYRAGSLICTSDSADCESTMDDLKERLVMMNANTKNWGGVLIFQGWKEPGREHILGHDGEVVNWVLDIIEELTSLYRLSVPVDFPYPERPDDLSAADEDGATDFWEELHETGEKDGERGDRYCAAAESIVSACRKVESEYHGFHCGWQKEGTRFVAYLKGDKLIRLKPDGSVRVKLKALPEAKRPRIREEFKKRFHSMPGNSDLYVMHFGPADMPDALYDWITFAGETIIAPRE